MDVDGFVFIRKRKAPATSSADSHKKSKSQTTPAELLHATPANSNTAAAPIAANGPTTPQAAGQPEAAGSEQAAHAAEDTDGVNHQANGAATPDLLGVVPQATPAKQEAELASTVHPSNTSAETAAAELGTAGGEQGAQEPDTARVFADPGEASEDEQATAERLLAQLPTGLTEADRLMALCNLLIEVEAGPLLGHQRMLAIYCCYT